LGERAQVKLGREAVVDIELDPVSGLDPRGLRRRVAASDPDVIGDSAIRRCAWCP